MFKRLKNRVTNFWHGLKNNEVSLPEAALFGFCILILALVVSSAVMAAEPEKKSAIGGPCLTTQEWFAFQGVPSFAYEKGGEITEPRFLNDYLPKVGAAPDVMEHTKVLEMFIVQTGPGANADIAIVVVLKDSGGCAIGFMVGPSHSPEFEPVYEYLRELREA